MSELVKVLVLILDTKRILMYQHQRKSDGKKSDGNGLEN